MQRPPRQPWQYAYTIGLSNGGYSYPANFPHGYNFQYPANTQYYQQHSSEFQNPSHVQAQNAIISDTGFPAAGPSSIPPAMLEVVDRLAAKVHQNLVETGANISAWKVSQKVIAAMKEDSWNSLGFQVHDVPTLQRLFVIEGKVDAFIHCFVCARKITSMYELEVSLCENLGVGKFEKLGLGPFILHPLVKHYFAAPSDSTKALKVTSDEIILSLQEFMSDSNKKVSVEKFLLFLAERKSVPVVEKLGVRIRDLGLLVRFIRDANKAEYNLRQKLAQSSTAGLRYKSMEVAGKKCASQRPNICSEKKFFDKRFDYISCRVRNFSSMWGDSDDKHVYFVSSDEGYDSKEDVLDNVKADGLSKKDISHQPIIPPVKNCGQPSSSCPYPSNTEEMQRLGLKPIKSSRKLSPASINQNTSTRKRKRKPKNDRYGPSLKFFKSVKSDLEAESQMCDATLTNGDMEKFVATWKAACGKHPLPVILDMMLKFYFTEAGQRMLVKTLFSVYPLIGLFNVAVMSMKRGTFTSIYDTFQAFSQTDSSALGEMIDVGPTAKVSHRTISVDCGCSVEQDDIIKKIVAYFESNKMTQNQKGLSLEKLLEISKNLYDCQTSLLAQFNVKEFCALGHGSFYDFLGKHIFVLPLEMQALLGQQLHEESSAEIYLNQLQLAVVVSQAEGNLMTQDNASKFDTVSLLAKQFPTVSLRMNAVDPDRCFQGFINKHKEKIGSGCVLFSTCLFGQKWNKIFLTCKENSILNNGGAENNTGVQHSFRRTSKDAIDCLLNTPLLEDLLYWSHWDLLYAPSLGPLSDFLLNKMNSKSLLCIATINGKFIRVDHNATIDEFLEAFVQCSSYRIALKLLSLICLYRGTNNAPLALLKCYSKKAVDVLIQNSVDSVEEKTSGQTFIQRQFALNKCSSCSCDFSNCIKENHENCKQSTICDGSCRVNDAVATISKTLLDCLQYLPSEFRSFAADIFLSGLQSITKLAPSVILNQCHQTECRVMLHDIGLSLGVTEWATDHHQFSLQGDIDLPVTSKYAEQFSHASAIESQKISVKKIADSLVVDENCQSSSGVKCSSAYTEVGNQALCKTTFTDTNMSEEQVLNDATAIIELIRQEEFGLSSNSNKSEDILLKRQHARLGRALHCLSQELYSQDSHFILELVQNADDNFYSNNVEPELVFILQETGIVVLNNELGFSAENIRALCDVGNSTKKASGGGYIGKKGIGFKSVFRVTDAPEIHSNGFHVKFDITEGQIGFVLPTVTPPCDTGTFQQYLYDEGYQDNAKQWNTCIVLPFRSHSKKRTGVNSILMMFSDLHPSLLLFLHRLHCIKFINLLNDKLIVMRKKMLCDGIVKISYGTEIMSWLVISKKLPPSVIRTDITGTNISIAFTLQESDNGEYVPVLRNQPVFAYLPLRNYGLKFILQGDFILPSSREEVDASSAWNQWLLSEFPSLFLSAKQAICKLPCFIDNPGKAVSIYLSFVPLNGEVHGFFAQLPQMIISLLRVSCCLLQDSSNLTWVLPCRVLCGWNEQVRLLLSDHLLQRHLGLTYLHKDVKLSDTLAMALGIREYGPKILMEVMQSVCHTSGDLKFLGIDWVSAWFSAIYSSFSENMPQYASFNTELECDIISDLKNIPLIPLLDGSYGSVADNPIWLPSDVLNIESKCKYHPEDFPCLYSKLQIVDPQLFSVATKNAYSVGNIKPENIIHMLLQIGVRQLSEHEIIKSHIFSSLSNKHSYGDSELILEYLSYIMLHLQSDCVSCHSERAEILTELQRLPVILTNHGFKCSSKEPIHFGREYGNTVNADFLFDAVDIKWVEVDPLYLKHPTTLPLPSRVKKWRDFFLDLGVTDFVQVFFADKPVEDFPFENAMNNVNIKLSSSFIRDCESPELVNILSDFSLKRLRGKCMYLLEVLDKMWDDSYNAYARSFIISKIDGDKMPIVSSFLKSLQKFSWISSTLDMDLHQPCKVYYDCEQVRSVLGELGPYTYPKVNSKVLANDIGFKMEVSIDDALDILNFWRISKSPFVASIAQMLNFYTLISSGIGASSSKLVNELITSCFIFVPFMNSSQSNASTSGIFLSPKDVYWRDPTGCVDKIKELKHMCSSMYDGNQILCQCLELTYPTLHDFFVKVCGVQAAPPFSSYFSTLQQLSAIALPSQAARQVFKVLVRWADDLKSGLLSPDQISEMKDSFMKLENAILPTVQDKWVSLHPSFGLICWADDEELKKQFKHFDGIDFIQFGELSAQESAVLSKDVVPILHIIGVPSLSEIVSREAILFGAEENRDKVTVVNWVLPYAQRYMHKLHFNTYDQLKHQLFEKLSRLRVIVANKLFYKYTLMGNDCDAKQRFECNCLLQGNTLYTSQAADSHSLFLELSRFFFNGTSDLHFANFLHMVTTMAQSGSTNAQIDFFAVNSQKIPALPAGEPLWSISADCETEKPILFHSNPTPSIDPEHNVSKQSHRKPGINNSWPPTDWKTAPGFARNLRPWQPYDCSPANYSKSANDAPCVDNWAIEEEVSILATTTSETKDSDSYPNSEPPPTIHVIDDEIEESDISGIRILQDRVGISNQILSQRHNTGRLGEMLAFKYFVENLGIADTRWVNEESESGLPYDLIVGEEMESRQYIEVKSTKFIKEWFTITSREWGFAVEKGDSYSIVHVSILGPQLAKIAVFKNPYKLCRQGDLNLALIIPKH